MLVNKNLSAQAKQRGLSLVELMIAMTLSLFLILGMSIVFEGNSRSRSEIERANQQAENGRYALQVLTDDIQMSGYLNELDVTAAQIAAPTTMPDPCATSVADLTTALAMPIQEYDSGAGSLSCFGSGFSLKPNTDVIVVRRASGCVMGSTDCDQVVGAPYFQASRCNSDTELSSTNNANRYRLNTDLTQLDRHKRDCTTVADKHQYLTRIYFIDDHDKAGDGIPTLKRAELGAGSVFTTVPIAEGIENLQFEYGIDTNNDGAADVFTTDPSSYGGCSGAACVANLQNVVSIKIYILSRNTSIAVGYKDTKTYTLGTNADGTTLNTIAAANDAYRRHVYSSVVKLINVAGRRES